jgi:DnaJ-like protein
MGRLMTSRRAALDGLVRILDAEAPEELFTGPEDDAAYLYDLLVDVARGRRSSHYWEICRTARSRSVTPEYVVDRALVLVGTIEERRRADLYRILGVPGLASPETIRQRWLEIAKQHHPDVGGDGARFRQAKEAYELLRDPDRRATYERFWLRANGPFERVAARDDVPALEVVRTVPHDEVPDEMPTEPTALPNAEGPLESIRLGALVARLELMLAPLAAGELEAIRADVARSIDALEAARAELAALAAVKQALGA